MLPAASRLTHRDDFTAVVRRGRRSGRTLVVVHVLVEDQPVAPCDAGCGQVGPVCAKVGFVVSKAIGGSVVRHRVARRLRHLMRDRLAQIPAGARVVVRALPASATAESASLARDVDRALHAALVSGSSRGGPSGRRP